MFSSEPFKDYSYIKFSKIFLFVVYYESVGSWLNVKTLRSLAHSRFFEVTESFLIWLCPKLYHVKQIKSVRASFDFTYRYCFL